MAIFIYPTQKIRKKLLACQTITLFGYPSDIYKVIFWDIQDRPYIIELKTTFTGEDDFGDPSPKWRKDLEAMRLVETLDRAAARKKLVACDYCAGVEPDLDTLLFVKYLLKDR